MLVKKTNAARFVAIFLALSLPFMLVHPALAADGSVGQIETFIRSIVKVLAGLTS